MSAINYVMLAFAALAALDRIFGNKFGLGRELERGINMLGTLTVSMLGMIVIAPMIAHLLTGAAEVFPSFLDFSIIPSMLLANDMGGAHLAIELASSEAMGYFNGLVVGSMMGCTVSFTIPYVTSAVGREHQKGIIFGLLCGIITVPVGCIVAAVFCDVPFLSAVINLIPLVLFSAIVAVGIIKFENATVKIFVCLGWVLKALITFGLIVGITEALTGYRILPYMESFSDSMDIILNIACIMMGAFPLLYVIRRLLRAAFAKLGALLGINESSAIGLFLTTANSVTTYATVDSMDERGVILNSAFAVSASFLFIDHLAFTLSFNSAYVPWVVLGKLVSGISAVALAVLLLKIKKSRPVSDKALENAN